MSGGLTNNVTGHPEVRSTSFGLV